MREESLDDRSVQFPRMDDRVNGRPYRFAYCNGACNDESTRAEGFDSLQVFDVQRGERESYTVEGSSPASRYSYRGTAGRRATAIS